MRNVTIIAVLFINSFALYAHNAQISTVALVQGKDNNWNLIISASLSAFQFELKNTDPSINLDSLNADTFQRMVVQHLRDQIKIVADGQNEGLLKNGKVILGHQTDVNFEVIGMPDKLLTLDFRHLGFGTLKDHFCILKVITRDNESTNYILKNENNHAVSLEYRNNTFTEIQRKTPSKLLTISTILVALVFVVGVFYSQFKKKKSIA